MSDLAARVIGLAAARGARIAIAESLTGGAVLSTLVDVPGASAVLRGGVVAYATELKHTLLDVPAGLLAERGPVDPDVVEAMALGALHRLGADVAVATTGVAGPDAQDGRPVGLVFIGVATRSEVDSTAHRFEGDRSRVRAAATAAALEALASRLDRMPPPR